MQKIQHPTYHVLHRRLLHCTPYASSTTTSEKTREIIGGKFTKSLSKYTPDKIRNFAIIAHIDHGKSTLSDRLLQLTNVIPADSDAQYLDKLEVERDRGITIKAQTCTMFYKENMLNLVDTPGHVDFSFEVKRSLVACDGAILLVAANQGIQAQTIFNFWSAFEAELTIVPVINKVDMPVDADRVERQMRSLFDFKSDEILRISAKSGLNVPIILDAIVERIPAPKVPPGTGPLLAHVFDSWYDHFKGVILLVIVKQGQLRRDMKISFFHNPDPGKEYSIVDVGFLHPEETPCESLNAGQVGFIHCGIKSTKDVVVRWGHTFESTLAATDIKPFMEIEKIKPTVYSGLFPCNPSDFERLKQAVESLHLNDSSVDLQQDTSVVFGQGWRVGFVGNLHLEVFGQRLENEHSELAVFTYPSVEYIAEIVDNEAIQKKRYQGQRKIVISKPSAYPEYPMDIARYFEPVSLVTIVTPTIYSEEIRQLCESARGEPIETNYIDENQMIFKWRIPLIEIIVDFFDNLKRISSGYASFDQKTDGLKECKLEKICIYLNDKPIEELSVICPSSVAHGKAKKIVEKLRKEIPRQQYEVKIKCCLGQSTKPIHQVTIKPMKKDFAGVLKGNFKADRAGKKLKHQKEGKEKMKVIGNVEIPREAFLNVVRK